MWFIAQWSKTVKLIITIIYIVVVLPSIILGSIILLGLSSARVQAFDARVASDMRSTIPSLELYNDYNYYKYPNTNSFSEMSSILIRDNFIDSELQEPKAKYHYRYCSTDGTNYRLEVEQFIKKEPFVIGSDTCQPGE